MNFDKSEDYENFLEKFHRRVTRIQIRRGSNDIVTISYNDTRGSPRLSGTANRIYSKMDFDGTVQLLVIGLLKMKTAGLRYVHARGYTGIPRRNKFTRSASPKARIDTRGGEVRAAGEDYTCCDP